MILRWPCTVRIFVECRVAVRRWRSQFPELLSDFLFHARQLAVCPSVQICFRNQSHVFLLVLRPRHGAFHGEAAAGRTACAVSQACLSFRARERNKLWTGHERRVRQRPFLKNTGGQDTGEKRFY